jgi:hypothetical protein
MKSRFSGSIAVALVLGTCVLLGSGGCAASEGFAVYLTAGDIPPAQMEALSHIEITGQPVFSAHDITTYNADTYEITLTTDAYERISDLNVPTQGRSFVVCVEKQPLYWGAFWTPISSQSFSGVVIQKPFGTATGTTIKLEMGYPSPAFQTGADPRDNADVLASLQKAGKLIRNPVLSMLPASFKGYELYSWVDNDQWHFVLMPGTNRDKTLAEIVAVKNGVSMDGWAHVTGMNALDELLHRIPRDEYVMWLGGLRGEPATCCDVNLTLPPPASVEAIKTTAAACSLNLTVQGY